MIKKYLSFIFFFWSVVFFCLNLQFSYSDDLKIITFWLSLLLMVIIVIYQIYYVENKNFILFEIIIVFFLLHLVYQINYYGFIDKDCYRDFDFLKTIISNHHIIIDPVDLDVSGWPLLHVFTSIISVSLRIDPLSVAKILPSFLESIIAIPLYLLVYAISKNKKAALFSCLILATIPQFVSFESAFVRESYALFFFILFFYLLYVSKRRSDMRLLSLLIILIPIIVFSHHFTAFMLIVLLLLFWIVSKIIPFLYRKKIFSFLFRKNEQPIFTRINIVSILIVLLIAVFTYWSYFTPYIINNFFSIFYEAIGIKEFGSYGQTIGIDETIVTLRGNIQYYGFFFFQGFFSLILFLALCTKKYRYIIENATFTFYLYFCLFLGGLSLYVLGSLIYPDRFLPFGWLLGVVPLAVLVLNLKRSYVRRLLLVIIVVFLIFNIYDIDPKYYTGDAAVKGSIATQKEYAIAESINISSSYYGYLGVACAIYDVQGYEFRFDGMLNPVQASDFFNKSHLAIIYKNMYLQFFEYEKIKSPIMYQRIISLLSYENSKDVDKICDLGDIYVLTWKNK